MIKGGKQWQRRQEWLKREKLREATAENEAEKVLKMVAAHEEFKSPEGLREMLVEKVGLQAWLQKLQKKPVVVSVDRIQDRWVFVVRGIRPPIDYWEGKEIWFVRGGSHHVWSPTKPIA